MSLISRAYRVGLDDNVIGMSSYADTPSAYAMPSSSLLSHHPIFLIL